MPRGSSWMMLIGGIVLLLGVVLAGWLSPSPAPAVRTLDPGESVSMNVSAEAGQILVVVVTVRDPAPGNRITTIVETPYGTRGSTTGAAVGRTLAQETGIYTVVIQNSLYQADSRAVTIEYTVTTTTTTEMMLTAAGPSLAITGFFIVVGGLGLRFAWRGLRGYWES